jgi:hypothetical protein
MFNIANRALATVSAVISKEKPLMIKSKTTSNVADILDGRATMMGPETNSSRTSSVKGIQDRLGGDPRSRKHKLKSSEFADRKFLQRYVTRGLGRRCQGKDT